MYPKYSDPGLFKVTVSDCDTSLDSPSRSKSELKFAFIPAFLARRERDQVRDTVRMKTIASKTIVKMSSTTSSEKSHEVLRMSVSDTKKNVHTSEERKKTYEIIEVRQVQNTHTVGPENRLLHVPPMLTSGCTITATCCTESTAAN